MKTLKKKDDTINMKMIYKRESLEFIVGEETEKGILTNNQQNLILKKLENTKGSFMMDIDSLESKNNKSDIKTCFIVYNSNFDKYFYISCKDYIETAKPKYLDFLKDLQNKGFSDIRK